MAHYAKIRFFWDDKVWVRDQELPRDRFGKKDLRWLVDNGWAREEADAAEPAGGEVGKIGQATLGSMPGGSEIRQQHRDKRLGRTNIQHDQDSIGEDNWQDSVRSGERRSTDLVGETDGVGEPDPT